MFKKLNHISTRKEGSLLGSGLQVCTLTSLYLLFVHLPLSDIRFANSGQKKRGQNMGKYF